jgi:hypothetical protein
VLVPGGAARTSTSAVVWVCETPADIGPALAEAVERLVSAFAGAESGSSPADMLALGEMDERLNTPRCSIKRYAEAVRVVMLIHSDGAGCNWMVRPQAL